MATVATPGPEDASWEPQDAVPGVGMARSAAGGGGCEPYQSLACGGHQSSSSDFSASLASASQASAISRSRRALSFDMPLARCRHSSACSRGIRKTPLAPFVTHNANGFLHAVPGLTSPPQSAIQEVVQRSQNIARQSFTRKRCDHASGPNPLDGLWLDIGNAVEMQSGRRLVCPLLAPCTVQRGADAVARRRHGLGVGIAATVRTMPSRFEDALRCGPLSTLPHSPEAWRRNRTGTLRSKDVT
jgi:hypothetical protein